ncbi:uncharacterized protein LOC131303398 [Rhododendron vialii]|uniref:uncharacterized protein LOC131303398 n=1 Tax=Rhododendron vialii TaxID=182163 RepID=UPI00265E1CCF|nr:uncharacterized protein LOC131303398 [Rhododendron vialii]
MMMFIMKGSMLTRRKTFKTCEEQPFLYMVCTKCLKPISAMKKPCLTTLIMVPKSSKRIAKYVIYYLIYTSLMRKAVKSNTHGQLLHLLTIQMHLLIGILLMPNVVPPVPLYSQDACRQHLETWDMNSDSLKNYQMEI